MDLRKYDLILISTSSGKDSQTILDVTAELAHRQGVSDRCLSVHADLGPRDEWPGVVDLAAPQSKIYGIPFHRVSKIGTVATRDGTPADGGNPEVNYVYPGYVYGDWLAHSEFRGKWPDVARRWCTSDWKRGPIERFVADVCRSWGKPRHPYKVLSVIGLRAEESRERSKANPFALDKKQTRLYSQDVWLPIHAWTEGDVWANIRRSGIPHHPCYDWGMSRCSCIFCIMGSKADKALAARLRPDLLREYCRVERKIGHLFTQNHSICDLCR